MQKIKIKIKIIIIIIMKTKEGRAKRNEIKKIN
jgi:hypothetical protein